MEAAEMSLDLEAKETYDVLLNKPTRATESLKAFWT